MSLDKLVEQAKGLMDSLMTPEVIKQMTPEQLNLVNEAKNSLNLQGDLSEKLEILKKYTDVNKHK
jgi:hypothetical protein